MNIAILVDTSLLVQPEIFMAWAEFEPTMIVKFIIMYDILNLLQTIQKALFALYLRKHFL